MRSVYYQSVGNPVQNDRLPRSRPTMQMLAPSLTLEEKINSMLGFALLRDGTAGRLGLAGGSRFGNELFGRFGLGRFGCDGFGCDRNKRRVTASPAAAKRTVPQQ